MSLIYFHIALISSGIAFFSFFSIWELGSFADTHKAFDLAMAISSFIFSFALACYLIWFLKKKKPLMK